MHKPNNAVYRYSYNGDGALSGLVNQQTGEVYSYDYDTLGRLVNFTEKYDGTPVNYGSYKYDSANRVEKYSYFIPGTTPAGGRYEQSTYNNVNGNLTSFRTAAGSVMTNTYGGLNRITSQKLGNFYTINYGYKHNTSDSTTATRLDYKQYNILSQAGTGMSYVYDAAGNITSENNKMTGYTSSYTYDAQNQLSTAKVAGAATYDFTYNYDTYGNLRSKTRTQGGSKQTDTYSYTDSGWLDLLTAYNGKTITYDTIGNPLTHHDGTTFTWEKGRRLLSLNQANKNLSVGYVYSANGQRMQKTVKQNGTSTVHQFYLQEGRLLGEARGNNRLEYIYDAAGNPTMLIYNGTLYYYITNQMEDVVQIRDTSGNTVASYTYDPYGALLSSSGNMAAINPLRYRGYYYDVESGLYYLNSRYYDPVTARFINADGYVSTGQGFTGLNMFAYCNNNPVSAKDPNGEFVIAAVLVGITIGLAAIGSTVVAGSLAGNYNSSGAALPRKLARVLPTDEIATSYNVIKSIIAGSGAIGVSRDMVQTKERDIDDIIIYRYGYSKDGINKLVPTAADAASSSGLSFSTVPRRGAAKTTVNTLNATGLLYAVKDGKTHVSVYPVGETILDWYNSGVSSIWTQTLDSACIKWDGGN